MKLLAEGAATRVRNDEDFASVAAGKQEMPAPQRHKVYGQPWYHCLM